MKNFFSISILVLAIAVLNSCESQAQKKTIPVLEFADQVKDAKQILDVRTIDEYNSGHLANALQADWTQRAEFAQRVNELDKNEPVYVYCLSGGRSDQAMNWLSEQGYKQVYNMEGGINQWKAAKLPLQDKVEAPQMSLAEYKKEITLPTKVLVDVGATWCPPCKKMKPLVNKLEKEGYKVVYVDGGVQDQLCDDIEVDQFPTFIVYDHGEEVKRYTGVLTYKELKQLVSP